MSTLRVGEPAYPVPTRDGDVPIWGTSSKADKNNVIESRRCEIIISCALDVAMQEKMHTSDIHRKILNAYVHKVKKWTMPPGLTKEDFDIVYKSGQPITGHYLWMKYKQLRKLFRQVYNPVWKKLVPNNRLPSGQTLPQVWLAFREKLFDLLAHSRKNGSPPVFTPDWFPVEFNAFVKFGVGSMCMSPVAARQFGYPQAPLQVQDAAQAGEPSGRVLQREEKRKEAGFAACPPKKTAPSSPSITARIQMAELLQYAWTNDTQARKDRIEELSKAIDLLKQMGQSPSLMQKKLCVLLASEPPRKPDIGDEMRLFHDAATAEQRAEEDTTAGDYDRQPADEDADVTDPSFTTTDVNESPPRVCMCMGMRHTPPRACRHAHTATRICMAATRQLGMSIARMPCAASPACTCKKTCACAAHIERAITGTAPFSSVLAGAAHGADHPPVLYAIARRDRHAHRPVRPRLGPGPPQRK